MFTSLVAELETPKPVRIPDTHGEAMQGELFRRLNALDHPSATWMHGSGDGRPRYYTISALRTGRRCENGNLPISPGDRCWFRVTGYHPDTSQILLALSEFCNTWLLYGPGFHSEFRIRRWCMHPREHPWACLSTIEDVGRLAGQAMDADPNRIVLHFESPTAFTKDDAKPEAGKSAAAKPKPFPPATIMPLPLPWFVFGSLKSRFSASCSEPAAPTREDLVGNHVAINGYKLETHSLQFRNGGSRVGFTGQCEYHLDPRLDIKERLWLHALAEFAFFCGVGGRTTAGMGQVRRILL
jgi:hypothetical protein